MSNDVRSDWVALAKTGCVSCNGTGLCDDDMCSCVDRKVFRIVLAKIRTIAVGAHLIRPLALVAASRPYGQQGHGRRNEEFTADVYLTAKRTLTDPIEWDLFRFHYMLGADWRACCPKLGNMDRGTFWHCAYRVEEKLGKMWRELQPFPLYPVDEYFRGATREADIRPLAIRVPRPEHGPLRPPWTSKVDPYEAAKEDIRARYSQGQTSLKAIADDLNQCGVRPLRAGAWRSEEHTSELQSLR